MDLKLEDICVTIGEEKCIPTEAKKVLLIGDNYPKCDCGKKSEYRFSISFELHGNRSAEFNMCSDCLEEMESKK